LQQGVPAHAAKPAFAFTLILALVLLILGLVREFVGRGSLFHDARMLGDWAGFLDVQVFRADMGFLLAMLPPGAFIAFGLLLAARNWMNRSS
jgi:electron transport complex protein RnfE